MNNIDPLIFAAEKDSKWRGLFLWKELSKANSKLGVESKLEEKSQVIDDILSFGSFLEDASKCYSELVPNDKRPSILLYSSSEVSEHVSLKELEEFGLISQPDTKKINEMDMFLKSVQEKMILGNGVETEKEPLNDFKKPTHSLNQEPVHPNTKGQLCHIQNVSVADKTNNTQIKDYMCKEQGTVYAARKKNVRKRSFEGESLSDCAYPNSRNNAVLKSTNFDRNARFVVEKSYSCNEEDQARRRNDFVSAKSKLKTKRNNSYVSHNRDDAGYVSENSTACIGAKKRAKFKPPARIKDSNPTHRQGLNRTKTHGFRPDHAIQEALRTEQLDSNSIEEEIDPRLKGLDPQIVERIESEVLLEGESVTFDDIAGLEFAKQNIEEIVIWPIRSTLFGPPGTGKTLIGKAIAHEVNATFFCISASSLTSKWIGEGEKTVRALFGVAAVKQPSVVFIDEIDSLLSQRSSDENEASRRIKTEFLVQLDGAATKQSEMVLVIGATNRPQELDEAARRRFVKRLYIPLPDIRTRKALLQNLLKKNDNKLSEEEVHKLSQLTEGYSGADVTNLAREASMGPLRDKMRSKDRYAKEKALRPIIYEDFLSGLQSIRASVSEQDLEGYIAWNERFGTQKYIPNKKESESA